ncbi:MAG: sodium:calcium antiporter [Rhodovibrionaceae bacterium]
MLDFASASLPLVVAVFLLSAAAIATAGVWMVSTADRLADRTGLGEAITGAVLLGVSTSLSGTITSVTAALDGYAGLAFSNAVGGIAVQTFFLGVADLIYRRANLEHAAASPTNMLQGALLIALLAVPLAVMPLPEVTLLGIHPASFLLVGGYLFGLHLARGVETHSPWGARETSETRPDTAEEPRGGAALWSLLLRFALLAIVLTFAGFLIARSGVALAAKTGLDESLVGALMTATATSLPELVTTIAAVRRGALTLAVGGIIGGNTFDVLFLTLSDAAYRPGSLYHAVGERAEFILALTMLMSAVLLLGLIRRERYGFARIGFESLLILSLYILGAAALFFLF